MVDIVGEEGTKRVIWDEVKEVLEDALCKLKLNSKRRSFEEWWKWMIQELKDLSAPSNVVDQSVINSNYFPGSQESGMSGENSMGKSHQGNEISSESPTEDGTGPMANLLIPDRVPKEIVEVAKCKLSALVPLFEIVLSRGDVNPKIGCLIIPETYAQEYFPVCPERRGTPMRIWDSECRLWKFMLRTMMVKKKQLTVLDGTRKCIRTMQWKSGGICKKDPEGELFIGLKKVTGAGSSTDQYSLAELYRLRPRFLMGESKSELKSSSVDGERQGCSRDVDAELYGFVLHLLLKPYEQKAAETNRIKHCSLGMTYIGMVQSIELTIDGVIRQLQGNLPQ
ncbi:B3 domain-containing protein, partial [Drosera capensis]